MEFVDKYLAPHKIAILLFLAIYILHIIQLNEIVTDLTAYFSWIIIAWIGFDGRRRLGAGFFEGIITILSLSVLIVVIDLIRATPMLWEDFAAEPLIGVFAIVMASLIVNIAQTILSIIFVLIGNAAAKYIGGKQAEKKKQTKH